MKKPLFILLFIAGILGNRNNVWGQAIHYLNNTLLDSTTFTFGVQDSLHHILIPPSWQHVCRTNQFNIDTGRYSTTNTKLWAVGKTSKGFFTDSGYARGIMTDTVSNYPINANSWFVIKYFTPFCDEFDNTVISFWHKYQTTAHRDGGIVEYSLDSGASWKNVIRPTPCIDTTNFYEINDTLLTGEPAFSGNSNGWVESQFKLEFAPVPCLVSWQQDSVCLIRFRFKSDSIPDTLAGWIIGKINIEQDSWSSGVAKTNKPTTLNIYPNPSTDAIFNFPALEAEQAYSIEIINAMGSRVLKMPYRHVMNLSEYPAGLYFYRVTNGDVYYSGKLLRE